MHGLRQGSSALEEALAAALDDGRPATIALAHHQQGLLLARSGSLVEALPSFDEAVLLIEYVEEQERPGFYLNRGNVRLMLGMLRPARDDFARTAELARQLGLTRVQAKALSNLASATYVGGDLAAALRMLASAHQLDADVRRAGQLERAQFLMEAGLLDEAQAALAELGEFLRGTRANQTRAEAELTRAEIALAQHDWAAARTFASRAAATFRRRDSLGWKVKADIARWQAMLELPAGPKQVAGQVELALRGPAPDPATAQDLALVAAEAQAMLGRADQARASLRRAGEARRGEPLSMRLRRSHVRASVARSAQDPRAARRELARGLTLLARAQARHQSLDLRTAMAVHGNRLATLDLRVALETGSAETVFDSLERWRAMSHRRTSVTPPTDPELTELLSQLRVTAEDIRTAEGARAPALGRRKAALERAVREREWQLADDGRAERPIRAVALRQLLAQRATDAVSYFVLDDRLGAVTIVDGRATVHTLGWWAEVASLMARIRADLDALAGRLIPAPLREAISASLRRDLSRLDVLLLPDAVAESGALVVVPSRTLATAPWTLLPRRAGRPTTVALSASSWARGLAASVERPTVAALAGPGLYYAEVEVRDVAARWPSAQPAGVAAGHATALAKALTSYDLVHIAAHGTHNHDNPLFSSIRMSDGPLFAYDIPQDTAMAGHVVLSACELGLTTPRPGGEVLGLTAALLGLGARSIVSSVSRVGDDAAYETMLRYHKHLAEGLDSPTALALAVADDLANPAAFVCFGSAWSAKSAQPTSAPQM